MTSRVSKPGIFARQLEPNRENRQTGFANSLLYHTTNFSRKSCTPIFFFPRDKNDSRSLLVDNFDIIKSLSNGNEKQFLYNSYTTKLSAILLRSSKCTASYQQIGALQCIRS